jgi:hypothetical protein
MIRGVVTHDSGTGQDKQAGIPRHSGFLIDKSSSYARARIYLTKESNSGSIKSWPHPIHI